MDISTIVPILLVAVIGVLIIYVPRLIQRKHRVIAGAALFFFGLAALSLGMKLQDQPFLHSDVAVYAWLGICVTCIIVGIISLMS
jgi:hypothetical protein